MVHLEFSDGSQGDYDLGELIERDTVMVRPRRYPDFFSKCFLELGALCWPNGFELSPSGLHKILSKRGMLKRTEAA